MRAWPRRVALVALVLFGLSVGVPAGAVPEHGGFPFSWLTSWLTQRPVFAAFGSPGTPPAWAGPVKPGGYVPAEETDAHTGTGRAPQKVANGLDGYRPAESTSTKTATVQSGFDGATSKRDARRSSATADVFVNADGSVTRRVYGVPVNYRAADGSWQPISTRLVRGNRARWRTEAGSLEVSVAGAVGGQGGGATTSLPAADEHLVSMTLPGGQQFAWDLQDAAISAPTVSGSTATYPSVLPKTDLHVEMYADGVKETLVLASPQAPSQWVFPLTLNGLTPRIAAGGWVELVDGAGSVAAVIPRGVMEDAKFDPRSGQMSRSSAITYDLVTLPDGRTALRMTADAAWLADPARVYPVRVDPTTTTGTTGDVFVDNDSGTGSGDQNGDNLPVGTYNGGTVKARSFIHLAEFDDDGLTTKRITAAKLHLFLSWQYACSEDRAFSVYAAGESWTVDDLSTAAYPGPAIGDSAIGSLTVSDPGAACTNTAADRSVGKWVTASLGTATFNDWSSYGKNYGLPLVASETDSYAWKRFTSANYASGAYKPYLELTYTDNVLPQVDTRYPANNGVVTTLTPELATRAHDPDVYPNKGLTYQYTVVDSAGTVLKQSGWRSSPIWTIPSGVLAWNRTYAYLVQVADMTNSFSTWEAYAFGTSVPQPTLTSNLSQNSGKGFDPGTGNYTTSATDAEVSGVGPDLEITRNYNSLDRTTGAAFGTGWTSMLDLRATQKADVAGVVQTVTVRYPDGQEVAFGRNGDGTFTPPQGRYAVFKPILSGTTVIGYTLTDKDATTYSFGRADGSTAWKISTVTDANGRSLSFGYDTNGRATTVTSASGRSLHLTWAAAGGSTAYHVVSVATDPAVTGDATTVKTWTYAYATDRLSTVCAPSSGGGCTTYSYASLSQGPNTVLNTGPYSYWRLGDASKAVAQSSVQARSGVDNGVYQDVTVGADKLYNQSSTSASFNGASSFVQLPGKLVTDGSYQSVSLWFKTATPGGVLFSYNSGAITAGTLATSYTPALYLDKNGYLRGEFWQGSVSPIKSKTVVTDDAWHHVVLSGAGGTQTLYLDGVAQGSLAGTISMAQTNGAAYEYLGAGFIGQTWPDHANTGASPAKATYYTGQLSDAAYFTKALTSTEVSDIYGAARWPSPAMSKITRPSGKITAAITYSTSTGRVKTVTDEDGGKWTLNTPTIAGDSDVYAASVLGGKPVGYWRLADPAGTVDAVNEVDGGVATYAGTVTFGAAGPFADANGVVNDSKAVTLDGSTGRVSLPDSVAPSGAASAGIWFKTTATGGVLLSSQASALGDTTCPCLPVLWISSDGKLRGLTPSATPTGPLTSGIADKCADVANGSTANGTKIQLYPCNGTVAQSWTIQGDGTLRVLGKCLDITGGGTANGTPVQLYTCNGTAAQQWQPYQGGLRNPASGRCLDDPDASTVNGTPLRIWTCNGTPAQKWIVSLAGPVAVNDGKWHNAVLTSTGTVQTLYVDGEEVQTSTSGTAYAPLAQPFNYLGAGYTGAGWSSLAAGTTAYFKGSVAEAAFYTGTLSADDVTEQLSASRSAVPQAVTAVAGTVKTIAMPVQTITVTDPTGKIISYAYDVANGNRQVSQTDAIGKSTRYGYDTGGFSNLEYDENGHWTQTIQDDRGNTVQQITCQDQENNKCSSVYYEYFLNAADPVDPRNDQLLTTRDARSSSAADNTYKTTNAYDAKGNATTVTDPLNRVTTTTYTDGTTTVSVDGGIAPAGLPATVMQPSGATDRYEYFANGDLARETSAAGKVTTYTYDGLGRKLTETEVTSTFRDGLTTSYTYDDADRVLTQTDPSVTNRVTGAVHTAVTTNVYDTDGNLTSQTTSDSTGGDVARTETVTYNQYGQKATQTDEVGKSTAFAYDAYGNVVLETEADGGQTRYELDANGNLLNEYLVGYTGDPNNPQTASDKLIKSTEYDPAGRVATETDAMGWVTRYDYTDNGLVAIVTRADGPSASAKTFVTELNTYDAAGNMTQQITDNGATTTKYEYDAAGRLFRTTVDPNGLNRVTTTALSADDSVVSTKTSVGVTGTVLSQSDTMYDPEGSILAQTAYLTDPATTPISRWKLTETSGTQAADSAGNAKATVKGGVTWTGTSAMFDGTTGNVVAADPVVDTSRSFTVSAWVTLADKNADHPIVWKTSLGSTAFRLGYDVESGKWLATGAQLTYAGSWKPIYSASSPVAGTATHLALAYDASAGTYSMYVNGVLESTVSGVKNRHDPRGSFYIGKYSSQYMAGSIGDVQVYQSALTLAQVQAIKGGTAPAAGAGVARTKISTDEEGLALSTTDPNGDVTEVAYDEAGRPAVMTAAPVIAETFAGGSVPARPVTFLGYDTFGATTETVDANGNKTVHVFDRAGREYETQLPAYTPPGSAAAVLPKVSTTFDVLGQVASTTDELGKVTSYEYDQLGRVWKVTAPDGGIVYASYDLAGNQTWSKDATGAISGATFDYLGHQLTSYRRIRPSNVDYTTTYAYDSAGRLQSVTTPGGSTTAYTYNAAGETLTSVLNSSRTTKTAYDGLGRPIRTTDPDNSYETTTYDMLSRATATANYNASGVVLAQTSAAFDKEGNQLSTTDALGYKTVYSYDPTGMILSETQPINATDSIVTTFGYDLEGNRTRFTDGRGGNFWTTYNPLGLVESQVEPATTAYPGQADRTYTNVYDAAGRLVSQTQPGGVSQSFGYDDGDRLTSQSGSGAEGGTGTRTYGYDSAGRMTSFATPGGTNTIAYDDRGLPVSVSGPSGNSSFEYNLDGATTKRIDAAGTTSYNYFSGGRDSGLLSQVVNTAAGLDIRFDPYNDLGTATKLTFYSGSAAGSTRTFGYDDLHRMTSDELKTSSGATVAKIAYGWNSNGDETSKTTTNFAGVTKANTYKYDQAGRLTSWSDGASTTTYKYDKSGNRTQNGTRTFVYDERNRLVGDGSTTYDYTARGTLVATRTGSAVDSTTSDAFGQVLAQGATAGTQSYTYDALGRAIRSGFAYTGVGNDLAADSEATYVRDPSADLVGEVRTADQAKRLTLTDLHDDVVGQFTPTSAILDGSVTYDPLGKVLGSSGSLLGHLGYQSEWTESVTGRVNMMARWYNIGTGQFDTRDTASNNPVPDSINANRYQYGDGNPLTVTDPTGHWGFFKKVKKWAKKTVRKATRAVRKARSYTSKAWKYAKHRVKSAYHATKKYVAKKYHQAKRAVKKAVNVGRKYIQKKAHQFKQAAKKAYHKAKQAGKQLVKHAKRAVKKAVRHVKDGVKKATQWVKDHKAEIIGTLAGIAVGVGCGVAIGWTGVGAVACGALAGAVGSVVTGAMNGHRGMDLLKDAGTGALSGAIGGLAGPIGGKITGALMNKIGSGIVGRMAGGALGDGIAGGATDAAAQFATTGKVDWGQVGMSAAIGGATGAAGGIRGPRDGSPGSGGASTCHSFDPSTKVLMADGSTKVIGDVKIGDKVTATDPETGRTAAKPVTALHDNHDRDLADVTVKDTKTGKSTVLHTTWFHPFWNATTKQWTDAKDLKAGDRLHEANGRTTQIVTAIKVWTGLHWMRDLTVDEIHTYYVIAGDTPVLVHNCADATPDPKPSLISRIAGVYHRNKFPIFEGIRQANDYQDKWSTSVGRTVAANTDDPTLNAVSLGWQIGLAGFGFMKGFIEGRKPE